MKRTITILPATISLSGTDIEKLSGVAEMFNVASPCEKAVLLKTSLPDVEPKVFTYTIHAVGGRLWKQTITFDVAGNPLMTFDVADPWRLSEFSQQRNLRNALVAFVGTYSTLEKVVYDFT
jgi:hypothetical protein